MQKLGDDVVVLADAASQSTAAVSQPKAAVSLRAIARVDQAMAHVVLLTLVAQAAEAVAAHVVLLTLVAQAAEAVAAHVVLLNLDVVLVVLAVLALAAAHVAATVA